MNARNPKPNDVLRKQRQLRGWTQERVADELYTLCEARSRTRGDINAQMVSRWELGKHPPSLFWQEKLCHLYEKTPEELGFVEREDSSPPSHGTPSVITGEHISYLVKYHQNSLQMTESDDMDKKRRELLHLLSVAGSALFLPLPEGDWEKVNGALTQPSQLDESVLQNLETIAGYYWNIYRSASSKKAVLDGVLGQLQTFVRLLKNSHPQSLHARLCALACNVSQLAGEIFFDSNEYDSAQSCYIFASSAAKEARQYDLWACSLVRHSFILLYSGQYADALPLLQGAERAALHGDTHLATRYWVAAVSAQAYAGMGNLSACQHFLDIADGVQNLKGGAGTLEGVLRFDGSRLPEERGASFVKLGEPTLATSALQDALKQYPSPTRRRGMVLTDLATASLQRGNIEQACFYANEVIGIAHHSPSGILIKGLYTLKAQLEPFASISPVRLLDQQIRMLS